MHEFSIATDIVESVLEFARKHQADDVLRVRLQIGEMTGIDSEQLKLCYGAIIKESPIETSHLEIERVPTVVHCPRCLYQGPPEEREGALALATLECPKCGMAAEATNGYECAIKSVQFLQYKTPEA